jgi:lipopolysaccharide export system protein LptA
MYPELSRNHRESYKIWLLPAVFLFLLFSKALPGQNVTRINIEQARVLKVEKIKGQSLQRLVGDVILRQDSTWFYCDSVWKNETENTLEAVGNVHIAYSDSVDLYGDYLHYNGNTRVALLDSNVVLNDNRATLYTDHLLYDRNRNMAFYNTGGRIVDEENILTSKTGWYHNLTNDFYFRDSVVITTPDYLMNSDTLRYNTQSEIVYIYGPTTIDGEEDHIYTEDGWYDTRNDRSELKKNNLIVHKEQVMKAALIYYDKAAGYGRANGDIWLKDTVQDIILVGERSEFFRLQKYSYMTGNTQAILVDKEDSLFMHADTFRLVLDSAEKAKYLLAYHHIKFFREDLQGMCDSLVYRVKDSVVCMKIKPLLWTQDNQLSSDSILLHVSHNRIDSMVLHNMAFIVSRDANGTFDQIKGKEMRGYFRNNQLYRINVLGNAETIYFVREENGAMIGINKLISSNMSIVIDENQVKSIIYYTRPEGIMYPEKDLPAEEQVLKGFEWLEEQRPRTRDDIFKKQE